MSEDRKSLYAEALAYAAHAHDGQVRKGTTIPYVTHVVAVAELVARFGGDQDQQIGALLHDVLEDCGAWRDVEIGERFGSRVLAIVQACTDGVPDASGRKPDWRGRKEAYLDHLRTAHPDILLVSACDKVHNASSIVADLQAGVDVFGRFRAGREGTLWYYASLARVFRERLPGSPVARALTSAVASMLRLAGVVEAA